MALHGSSSGGFDIKSPAVEYVNFFISETPSMFDIAEDKGKINNVFYKAPLSSMRLRILPEPKDLEKRRVTMTLHGTGVPEIYKTIKATFTVTPKEHINGSYLAWMVEFEKIRHDIGDPSKIIEHSVEYLVSYFKKIDDKLHERSVLNGNVDFIDVKGPARYCFLNFITALRLEANLEVEVKHYGTRTSTMKMKSTHELMTNYKTLKVTTTVTPIGNDSQVAWTIESEQISKDINDQELSFDLAFEFDDTDLALQTVLYIRWMHERLLESDIQVTPKFGCMKLSNNG